MAKLTNLKTVHVCQYVRRRIPRVKVLLVPTRDMPHPTSLGTTKRVQAYRRVKYDYIEHSHDYDASWDYDVIEPPADVKPFIDDVAKRIREQLLPKLRVFKDFEIAYASEIPGKGLATYVDGTYSQPVIVIDVEEHREVTRKLGEPAGFFYAGLEMSIIHELGHALQEAYGLTYDEDEAESFAREWHDYGEIIEFDTSRVRDD